MAQSSDPDADAVLGSFDHPEAAHDSDAATVLASYDAPSSGYRPKSGSDPVLSGKQPELLPMLWEGGKEQLQGILHGAGTLADVATGTSPGAGSHAERWASTISTDPTMGGQISGKPAIAPEAVSSAYDTVAGTGPLAATLKERVPQAVEAIGTAVPAIKMGGGVVGKIASRAPAIDTQAALDAAAAKSPQSMGAAASAVRVNDLSPRMQQGFRKAVQETGGAVNPIAATNHAEADLHGVQLMEGQATREPKPFSDEQNSTNPAIVKRINDQETQMTDALDKIRREAAPGAVQNNHIENGQITVDDLKQYDKPIKADIGQAYAAAKAASATGDLQMDGSSFVSNANAALKPQSKYRFLPSTVKGILDDVANADGKMTLDDYQAYQTQLGNEIAKARRAGDGNAEAAITKVFSALKDTNPIGDETTQAKGLFDVARGKASARFDAMRTDPAYEAAVEEAEGGIGPGKPSPLADNFLDRYVIGKGAPKANVDNLMGKLSPDAREAVASHTLNQIRKAAITPNGKVSPDGYNSAMQKYGPKLGSLVSGDTAESLDSLGRVITNAKVPPPGHSVNYSKSGVIVNAAQGLGEAAVNAKTFGLGMPVIKQIAESRATKRALAPGAGLTRLSDVAK